MPKVYGDSDTGLVVIQAGAPDANTDGVDRGDLLYDEQGKKLYLCVDGTPGARSYDIFVRDSTTNIPSLASQAKRAVSSTVSIDVEDENGIIRAYTAEIVELTGDQTISSNTFWGSSTPDDRFTIVKVNGNLTISAGVTVTTLAPKLGLLLHVTGNCQIDGVLSMTARGANHGINGSDITPHGLLIAETAVGTDRLIPAQGSADRVRTFSSSNASGLNGYAGTNGGTGGGATGGGFTGTSTGRGGTCFGGGAAGGAVYNLEGDGGISTAEENGGAGGDGSFNSSQRHGAGAGNPGGLGSRGNHSDLDGDDGTGGCLYLFGEQNVTVGSGGSIVAHGSTGGGFNSSQSPSSVTRGGGGSGAGSINVYYVGVFTNNGSLQANGGPGGTSSFANGAPGGAGSVRTVNLTEIS